MSALTDAVRERALDAVTPLRMGRVVEILGLHLLVTGLKAAVGDLVEIDAATPVLAEVGASSAEGLVCLPLGPTTGLTAGALVRHTGGPLKIHVGEELRGRVLDGLGRPHRRRTRRSTTCRSSASTTPPPAALTRPRIDTQVGLGVRALDSLTPCGRGQRSASWPAPASASRACSR